MNAQCFHIRSLALARRTVSDWHLHAGLYLTGTRTQDPVEEQAAPEVVVWDLRPDATGLAPVAMAAPTAAPGAGEESLKASPPAPPRTSLTLTALKRSPSGPVVPLLSHTMYLSISFRK